MPSEPLTSAPELAATTLDLCRIASVTGQEAELATWVERRLHRLPVAAGHVRRWSNSLILEPLRRPGRPLVLLVGHLDTVPPRQDRPPNLVGDWLEGCGASDMKCSLAVMLHLVEELPLQSLPVDVGLVFYEREEGPFEENYLGPLLAQEPFLGEAALAVCMEPTDNRVQVGCLGAIHATVTFSGRRAHSARPWQGENAVHKAGPLLTRLGGLAPRDVAFGPVTFREVAAITMVQATGTRNVVPDAFSVNLNYRFAPGKTLDQAQAEVLDLVGEGAHVAFTDLSPSGRVSLDNPLVSDLVRRTGPPEPKQAWTDVARFSAIGVDAVNFGPGQGAQAHQCNEGVAVSEIWKGYEVVRDWLRGAGG